jgi:hypothetical protein
LRGFGVRPETSEARRCEAIDEAVDQRLFRSDDRQVDRLVSGQSEQGVDIIGANLHISNFWFGCSAGISGCNQHFVNEWRLRRFPCQRMLASAAAND